MKLVSYNIQYGRGRDGVFDASLGDSITVARIDSQAAGSDHQPLWVEIDLD